MMSDLRLMVQWMLSVEVALSAKSGTACSSQLASFALGLPYLNSVLLVYIAQFYLLGYCSPRDNGGTGHFWQKYINNFTAFYTLPVKITTTQ